MASRERFRAIFLTSLTTVAGLVPLLTETSTQAQVLIPLTASIVFGLSASTVLILVVVPCLLAMLHDLGLGAKPEAGHGQESADTEVGPDAGEAADTAVAGDAVEPGTGAADENDEKTDDTEGTE